ncbi:MAG: hypothetical protein QOC70_912 [Verrucomicrobiota bacterium]
MAIHEGGASLGVAEDQEHGWPQRQSDGASLGRLINASKDLYAFGSEERFKPIYRFTN